jgi:hypothetical protein
MTANNNSYGYRNDLLQWRWNRLKKQGDSFDKAGVRVGLPKTTLYEVIKGQHNPTLNALTKSFNALGLNPKYALDFDLKKSKFHLAVL